jgi:hypothetical protein
MPNSTNSIPFSTATRFRRHLLDAYVTSGVDSLTFFQ